MAHAFTPGLAAAKRIRVRKLRELPVAGEILKKVGDTVRADEIVARAALPGDLQILRIPEKMGIEPFEVLKGIKVREGATLHEGELVCEHAGLFGLFKTRFASPCEGKIEFVAERTGHVGVRMAPKPIEVDAYISGKVVAIEAGKSVTIESHAAFLQGIFGVGGERKGRLKLLPVAPEKELSESDIPEQCAGLILVGGMCPQLGALNKAQAGGAVGLVTGSIDDQALSGYLGFELGIALTGDEPVSMSVIVTEGFGSMPMSQRALSLLQSFDGRAASINGATQVRAGALRPEVIIGEDVGSVDPSEISADNVATGLNVGSRVRIIRVPFFGASAEVVELPVELCTIPTGAEARVLKAKLDKGGVIVTVPRANVELL